ncbi:hypothetical protein DPMN_157967 [Dreissena polymorpha]|uniref:C1q domain-containing protein n=1 Tax=Dreissena polymorpha TaxID=45954 RepID=A0A9D4IPC4_DREPO|nr:hypothetical protein DPMN_157967 [Dreissena polymorpha]
MLKENTFTGVELGSQFLYSEEHGAIAFSATSSHNQNVLENTTVKYHTKLVDDGDSLNLSSGVFTAQSSGYYMFHLFSTSRQHEELWLDLRQNGAYVCSIYGFTEFDWASAGNSVILHLSSGDNVGFYSRPGHESHLFGSADHVFTTFSGAQLVSDFD